MWESGLIRKIRLISKLDNTIWRHNLGNKQIATYILLNIPRSKDNQTMKFGQSKEDNMRKIFLEKSYTECGG